MRIRTHHVVWACVFGLAGFLVVAMVLANNPGTPQSEEEFLQQVQQVRDRGQKDPTALLPPQGDDPNDVPRIALETDFLELGDVPNNAETRSAVKIYNRGKRPLRITDIQTTCPCTMGYIDDANREVPPGGEVTMEVVFDPYRVASFYSHKILTITSNDPINTKKDVEVKANIDPEFLVEPFEIQFGDVPKGATPEQKIRVAQIKDTPFVLERVTELSEVGTNVLDTTFVQLPEEQWQSPGKVEYEVTVKISPRVSPGELYRQIVLYTNQERLDVGLRLSVVANITSPYTISHRFPNRVVATPDTPGVATLTSTQPVTISNVQSQHGKLVLDVLSGESEYEVKLQVTVPPGTLPGSHDDVFTFDVSTAGEVVQERLAARAHLREPAGGADASAEQAPAAPAPAEGAPAEEAGGEASGHDHEHGPHDGHNH